MKGRGENLSFGSIVVESPAECLDNAVEEKGNQDSENQIWIGDTDVENGGGEWDKVRTQGVDCVRRKPDTYKDGRKQTYRSPKVSLGGVMRIRVPEKKECDRDQMGL